MGYEKIKNIMKKFISLITLLMLTTAITAQPMKVRHIPGMAQYTELQNYPIEMRYVYSEDELKEKDVIVLGGDYYMVKVENDPDFAVKFNEDHTKAIITSQQIIIEYTVKDTDSRLTLYHEKPYFGFVYDKKYKVLYFFNSKKYHRRVNKFIRKYPILPR